ncbi:hypothetical protein AYO49_05220 [Verrucomicrobiaceae bacterium SCGC AG-212-N21]|nr:hypothetical protein AYO49_05220 [Verrucomicrobiaceae bacterium SCGC AG-212-N21]
MRDIPPPPELPHWPKGEKGTRPTFWLYTEEGGITGPYTKKEARGVMRQNPEDTFLARRDGDGVWHDAATRLKEAKSEGMSVATVFALLLIVALAVGGYLWWKKETARIAASKKAVPQQQQTSTAPAASSGQ